MRVLTTPMGLTDVSLSEKNMFDRYYCIIAFCHLKTLENISKSSFCITIMARKSMKD